MTSILVTGASGLLGATIVHDARHFRPVVAFGNRVRLVPEGFVAETVDLLDRTRVAEVVAEYRPQAIINCAASTDVEACERSPEEARALNTDAAGVLAQIARQVGAQFVQVSTDSVFGGGKGNYSESDSPRPLNVYASTKLAAEKVVLEAHPESLVVRVNLFGWNMQRKSSLAEWVLDRLAGGQSVPGWTDVYFSPLFTGDLSRILLKMVDARLSGIYHLSGGERCSKYEFARVIAATWGYPPELVHPARSTEFGFSADRPKDTSLRCAKLAHDLGIALPDIRTGAASMRTWGEANLQGLRKMLA